MDRDAVAAARQVTDHEAVSEEACYRAAKLDGLAEEQADSCDGGEHRCGYCPWRNPYKDPAAHDRFILPNGREIEVAWINLRCVSGPIVQYRFLEWGRGSGGRAAYERKLSDWPKVVAGARLIRQGKKPRSRLGAKYDKQHKSRVLAFNTVNRRLGYIYSENDFSD